MAIFRNASASEATGHENLSCDIIIFDDLDGAFSTDYMI